MGNAAGRGTYGYFSLHSSFLHVLSASRAPSKRITAFHLQIEIPEGDVVLPLVLYHFYCNLTDFRIVPLVKEYRGGAMVKKEQEE